MGWHFHDWVDLLLSISWQNRFLAASSCSDFQFDPRAASQQSEQLWHLIWCAATFRDRLPFFTFKSTRGWHTWEFTWNPPRFQESHGPRSLPGNTRRHYSYFNLNRALFWKGSIGSAEPGADVHLRRSSHNLRTERNVSCFLRLDMGFYVLSGTLRVSQLNRFLQFNEGRDLFIAR